MTTSRTRHPEDDQLLRYLDGELPDRAAGEVRAHLESCWQCRVELDELQKTVAACVRYRKDLLQLHLPSPPAPWTDIYRRFAEIDASVEPAFFSRAIRALKFPMGGAKKWAVAAVGVMLACVLFYRFREAPSVQASELLRRAALAEDAHARSAPKPRRIQIRTRTQSLTRVAGSNRAEASNSAEMKALQALFVASNYDWNDPLSAKSFAAWHDGLADKRDQVTEERGAYRIRTDTNSGELLDATLTLRTPDLRPVEERLEFRNRDWVEITEIAAGAPPQETAAAAEPGKIAAGHASEPSTIPAEIPAPGPAASATIGDELHVMAALHQAGADLGDPIEVAREGGSILVTGIGLAPERQREIRASLGSNPHVLVRFFDTTPARVQSDTAANDAPAGAELSQLQGRLAQQLGGRVQLEQVSAQVLDLSESMMSRAYALRRLAERFPVDSEAQLGDADRQLLAGLRHEHADALRQNTAAIDRLMRPVLTPLSGSALAPAAAAAERPWQQTTEDAFQSARQVEKMLAVLFGAAPGEASVQQLPAQVLTRLAHLRATLEAINRPAPEAPERRK